MTEEHPTYPNPIIQEAVCEMRFTQGPDEPWKADYFSDFSEKVRSEFPTFEPMQQHAVQVAFGPQGVVPQTLQIEQRMKYKSKDGTRMLQLGPSSFVVNFLPRYPGWDQFEVAILSNWENAVSVIGNRKILRASLRYINKLPLGGNGRTLKDWLKASEYVPKSFIDSEYGGFLRIETSPALGRKVVVTVGQLKEAAINEAAAYVLDIDCICEASSDDGIAGLEKSLKELHDSAWKVFSASKTDKLGSYMNRQN